MVLVGDVLVSPKRREPTYRLSNGETVVVTSRAQVELPAGIDGVLCELGGGRFKWLRHRRLKAFEDAVAREGWPGVARKQAREWSGQFSFRAEGEQSQGLRPPQVGALHAVGAHWSLFSQPATVVMPTGTGKTETMLSILAAYDPAPLLVIVPSDPLRAQTARKFTTFGLLRTLEVLAQNVPNPIVGIVSKRPRTVGDLKIFESCNVVISTMSSLGEGEAVGLAPEIAARVRTLIVDEAHHIGAEGWARFREAFQGRKVLQFTATPFRRDGQLVDGEVIYTYPLRMAQQDQYFKKIIFEPVYEIDPVEADRELAEKSVEKLTSDLNGGLNHLLMARCATIDRATVVHEIYSRIAPQFRPMLVHSGVTDTDARLDELRKGDCRVVVCVNMLGEGFDLPELKIAAIHDLHKSLAVLLQFVGRFTRSNNPKIGDATVVANIADPDVPMALERLYSEDADWNQILSELSSDAAREHAELIEFLKASQRLDTASDEETIPISHQLLRPTLSTLFFEAGQFRPKRFHEGLPHELQVHRVWLNQSANTLFFVTRWEPKVKWTRSKSIRDREWALFVLHYDPKTHILFLSSTDHDSNFEKLASAVGASKLIAGDAIFRSLGHINRLIFQNVGVRKHGRRNLRYAMYTGADVAEALTLSERAGSVKSNLSGTGWENGRPVTIGCSYKGRVWSRESNAIPRFVQWCEHVGSKIIDCSIDTRQIIANVLIPEEQDRLPDKEVLGIEWPIELLAQSEERVTLRRGTFEQPLSMFAITVLSRDLGASTVHFELVEAITGQWATYALRIGGAEGFSVSRQAGPSIVIKVGKLESPVEDYLSNYPPMVRFVDLTELDGNLLIHPQNADEIKISEESFDPWDWQGTDITKESLWRDNAVREDTVQWRAAQVFIQGGFDVVFDDDAAGEAADLVCLTEGSDHIRLVLVHCKFAGGESAGERVKDVVEVCSQAVRSAKWKWKFRDLCRHISGREKRLATALRPTRFLAGTPADVNRFIKVSRFKEIRPEILIVQPGLSQGKRTTGQSAILASTLTYLKQTIGVDMQIVCSE